jgi:hypothetical protein
MKRHVLYYLIRVRDASEGATDPITTDQETNDWVFLDGLDDDMRDKIIWQ